MTYKKYITGLKGFACFMVMLGHFLGVLAYAESMPFNINRFLTFRQSKAGFLIDESYWLSLFFIISGYLLSFSKIFKLRQFFAKCIQRFLRLGLPVLFAYVIIFIIYKCIGFHNAETTALFACHWYQKTFAGEYSFMTVLMAPIDVLIFGKCSLNSPYWVLRDMLIASVMVYFANYLIHLFHQKKIVKYAIMIVMLIGSMLISDVALICILGALLGWCIQDYQEIKGTQLFYVAILLAAFVFAVVDIKFRYLLFFMALIILVPKMIGINKILSSKMFEFLGKISFGIYSFHWPLYCSVGALIMVELSSSIGVLYSLIIAMLGTGCLTVVISWLYHILCERFSGFLTKKVYGLLFGEH